ncbi:acyl-CoA N-acyltransferase [Annulohypoxylon maeteangense]|uniref:acyl-CoA N-acyltransferase n=1 Tax=Annulohypoxylon maeteangense TaxID=1927788 RepID=UPI002007F161|nr:acyl-CoA N-acyltransferase [Annulohypoxylon maeteangense]KAI0887602.1 acyl-CoA N-acyltransferase [Annulohypoxylon maeteangense]
MAAPPINEPVLSLPHPYLVPYLLVKTDRPSESSAPWFQVKPQEAVASDKTKNATPLPEPLHSDTLFFTEPADLKSSERPADSNNTPWGRARRSPSSTITWDSTTPTLAQAWLVVYVLLTIRPSTEGLRLTLSGPGKESLGAQLKAVLLAVDHPTAAGLTDELLVLRSTFWQGAGSPFGPRSVWVPESTAPLTKPLSAYPLTPLDHNMTSEAGALSWHPRRPAKPRPGSVVYSRWIPHLRETFSMVALDWENAEHLDLFHTWQNDPRVSQGWNETGSLEQHREYLRKAHVDPHQITLLAAFDDTFFAYFEVYWAKEDRLGAYYSAGDFDRGRHSLVGDVRFRGPHRVTAWWSSLMHYLFLDDPRTMQVVGEPKYINSSVLMYDFMHGFGLDKFVDLPHKRSAFVTCSRERFFQLAPLAESEKFVGGTLVGLIPKL